MNAKTVDLNTWPRANQFHFFKTYEKPHYAVTSRLDVTRLLTERKPQGISPYRACVYAIGAGVHAVPELCMRFKDDVVTQYRAVELSMTVPVPNGSFNYAYVPHHPEFSKFDETCRDLIKRAAAGETLDANSGQRDDLAYLSCLPWLDFTSINNALPGPEDCIPRISWGKFVQDTGGRWSMAMTIEVHHALVDGEQVGAYFSAVQTALNKV